MEHNIHGDIAEEAIRIPRKKAEGNGNKVAAREEGWNKPMTRGNKSV